MFKARSSNAGSVYIGNSSAVTVPGTTTNTTAGFELAASEQTPWMPCKNLDEFFYICDNTGDECLYWIAVS